VKRHRDANANEELSDDALTDRESSERREYMRLKHREPQLDDTTYRELTASKGLMHAWERWRQTSILMRIRGLLMRSE
jgi:hypothetical protein